MRQRHLSCLGLTSVPVQHGLRVAIGLRPAFEDQLVSSLVGKVVIKVITHSAVAAVSGVLLIYLDGYSSQTGHHLRFATDAMVQPVRQVLTGDPQCRPVFHQVRIADIRNLGATDAFVYPAHDIAEDALDIVIDLSEDLRFGQLILLQRGYR